MLDFQKHLSKGFLTLLSLPSTAMGFALSVQISALSWILTTQYQLDIHEVGIVWAAGPIAGIIGQVLIGIISDKVWFWGGRRRPFIWIGGVLASLSLLALPSLGAISSATGMGILVVAISVALTLDLSINISFNPTRSIIADVTPEGDKRTFGYTWMQTISGFFGVLAYAIGAGWGNYSLIYFGAILVLIFSLLPPIFITEPKALATPQSGSSGAETSQFGQLYRIYFAHGFCWLGVQTMFVYMIFFVRSMVPAASDAEAGQVVSISFLVLNTVGFLLPSLLLEPLASRIGRVRVHVLAMGAMCLGYTLLVGLGSSPLLIYIFMAVVGIGWAATVSLPFAIMTEKVEKNKMGLFMGIFNLSVVIPQLVVSLVFGKIIPLIASKNAIFIICAICLAISALLWTLVRESAVQQAPAQPNPTH